MLYDLLHLRHGSLAFSNFVTK